MEDSMTKRNLAQKELEMHFEERFYDDLSTLLNFYRNTYNIDTVLIAGEYLDKLRGKDKDNGY
jgi:hypothetical protein